MKATQSTIQDPQELFEKALPSVLEIRTGTGGGTGFIVRNDGLVLTCAHVVLPEAVVDVRGSNGYVARCRVIKTDRIRDIAAIQTPPGAGARLGAPLPLYGLSSEGLKVGQQVMTIGNPGGCSSFSCSNGYIAASGFQEDPDGGSFVQLDISVNWGNSGGPVIGCTGEVIAMAARINFTPDGVRIEGVSFGIPVEDLREFIDSIPSLEGGASSKSYCVVCGDFVEKSQYCGHCGSVLKPRDFSTLSTDEADNCPACHYENPGGVSYCENCGFALIPIEMEG